MRTIDLAMQRSQVTSKRAASVDWCSQGTVQNDVSKTVKGELEVKSGDNFFKELAAKGREKVG